MASSFPEIKTELPGPKAKKIISKDTHYCSSSYIKEYPLVVDRGEGSIVIDVDGNRFLDCMAGIAVNITGYNHPNVLAHYHTKRPYIIAFLGAFHGKSGIL